MAKGRVKWFSNAKGYGFIEREGESDVFVHYTAIQSEGYRKLAEGEEVLFEVVEGERGPIAKDVMRTDVSTPIPVESLSQN